jgi:hypothetical protein
MIVLHENTVKMITVTSTYDLFLIASSLQW